MENLAELLLILACICILVGYLRLITDENGNIELNSFRFFGSLGTFIYGMCEGSMDLLSRDMSKKSSSALFVYIGLILFYLAFNINN